MGYPRIYLAIDNCFASKRWTKPSEWMELIKELGIYYIEASADNECDPLYTTPEYLRDWIKEIKRCSSRTGVKVVNLYSGHGTYATLGLAHTDERIRVHILNNWLKPMVEMASELKAGMGFFCHAFSDSVLQNPMLYGKAEDDLYLKLAELAAYARDKNAGCLGVEQMYTPHQIPWTIQGAEKLLKRVYEISNSKFYITVDTGHQTGQRRFLRPDYEKLKEYLRMARNGEKICNLWLGPSTAYKLFHKTVGNSVYRDDSAIHEIESEMDKYPYLFSRYEDGEPYRWLEKLGCYSPIIHLQQTEGKSSRHLPFTQEYNKSGIIIREKVLNAVKCSYEQNKEHGMPPRCKEIYLTLELFSGTAEINSEIICKIKESVKYWRDIVPKDGMRLDELMLKI